jgi:hypothetical protein
LSDIEQNQLEEERQDRKKQKKKKKKKSKKKRKKSNDKKRGKEREKETTTTDEHDDEASLGKRTSTTGAATTTIKKKKPSIDGRRRKSYIFPIDEAVHSLCVDTRHRTRSTHTTHTIAHATYPFWMQARAGGAVARVVLPDGPQFPMAPAQLLSPPLALHLLLLCFRCAALHIT